MLNNVRVQIKWSIFTKHFCRKSLIKNNVDKISIKMISTIRMISNNKKNKNKKGAKLFYVLLNFELHLDVSFNVGQDANLFH